MKTPIALIIVTVLTLATVSMSFHISGVCDSPFIGGGHAGDPGNPNCTRCHTGAQPNIGSALLQIQIGDGSNTYLPDSVYDVVVNIAQSDLTKAGFEITALDSSLLNGGTLELTDTPRTRITFDASKRYLTSTPCGADADMTGMNMWSFKWRAPSFPIDTIFFYLAALDANHDDAVTGDTTYTQVIKVTPKILTGISKINQNTSLLITPNPADREVRIFNPIGNSLVCLKYLR